GDNHDSGDGQRFLHVAHLGCFWLRLSPPKRGRRIETAQPACNCGDEPARMLVEIVYERATRSTSSIVVTPSRAARMPSSSSVRMSFVIAIERNSSDPRRRCTSSL